jgi:CRP-like cAMP-binding protein
MKNFNKYKDIFKNVSLFDGIAEEDMEKMLDCIGTAAKSYEKDELIFRAGGEVPGVGIVLGGALLVFKEDIFARRSVMTSLEAGDIFGEVFACADIKKSPVAVAASTRAEVMFLSFDRIINICSSACGFHVQLINNMLRLLAQKNLVLNKKIDYLMIKGLRERLAAFLLEQSGQMQSMQFEIPFDRSGLADFLNADRSALSRELGRMKAEGLIDFYKNSFKLLDEMKLCDYLK